MRTDVVSRARRNQRQRRECRDPSDVAASRGLFGNELWRRLLKFLRQRIVAEWFGVEIDQMEPDAVLDLAFAEVAQTRCPLPRMNQIVRHVLREQDVPGITAIHHALRHVNASAGQVGPPVHVRHLADRAAVDPHAHRKLGMFLERFGNLERAPGRLLRALAKDERHAIAGREPDELFVGRFAHRRGREHDLDELVEPLLLLLVQELGVTDDVDEKDVPDFEAEIVVRLRHGRCSIGNDGLAATYFRRSRSRGYLFSGMGQVRGAFHFFSQLILISFSKTLNSGSPVTSSAFRIFASAAANASA